MIGFLSGKIVDVNDRHVILITNGVGYEVYAPGNVLNELRLGEEAKLWIHTNVKEDSISLFGFLTKNDKILFQKIIGISGIGPRTGMDIISTPRETLQNAVNYSDSSLLTTIPGIGKKTAEKLLVDLKSVFEKLPVEVNIETDNQTQRFSIDIVGALENLGFKKDEIMHALKNLPKDVDSEEEIMRLALREMSRK